MIRTTYILNNTEPSGTNCEPSYSKWISKDNIKAITKPLVNKTNQNSITYSNKTGTKRIW